MTKGFAIHNAPTNLRGHRELQVLSNKEGRACLGTEGMKIVQNLRSNFSLVAPLSSNYPHK